MKDQQRKINSYFKPGKLYKYIGSVVGRGSNNAVVYKDAIMMYVGEKNIYWYDKCYVTGFLLTNKGKVFFEFMKDSSIDKQPRDYFREIVEHKEEVEEVEVP